MYILIQGTNANYGDVMKKKKGTKTFSVNNYETGNAEKSLELVNKYGTYEIQPTANTENPFPKIAQGLPKSEN